MNAVIYVRVSTKQQSEQGSSLESQEEACRKLAIERGYSIGDVYREDYPGDTLDRPQLNRLRQNIRAGKFQAIVIYAMDRLSRDPVELLLLIQECDKAGVELLFVTDSHDNSIEGELLTYVRGWFGKLERLKIKERTTRGKASRAREGKLPQGNGAGIYGYRYNQDTGKREIDEGSARWVTLMFQRCAEGKSAYGIAAELIERGISTFSGKPWNPRTITNMLRNPSYKGLTLTNTRKRVSLGGRKYRIEKRDQADWVEVSEATPPIVTLALWNAAQERLNHPHSHPPNPNKREFLLTGYTRCICGSAMVSHALTARGVKYFYYRCINSYKDRTKPRTCPAKEIRAPLVEADVWNRISRILKDPDLISEIINDVDDSGAALEVQIKDIQARISHLDARQIHLAQLFSIKEDMPIEHIKNAAEPLQKQKLALQKELVGLQAQIRHQANLEGKAELAVEYCRRFGQAVDLLDFEDRRLALDALDVRVTVNFDKTWTVRGSIPIVQKPKELVTTGQTWA